MTVDAPYETDLVPWTERQAMALRRAAREGSNPPLDWENLAEEIESPGTSERRAVRNLVQQIIAHRLNLAYSSARTAWFGRESEVAYFRGRLRDTLESSPGLRPILPDIAEAQTPRAIRAAVRSLRKYGETDAAEAVERLGLVSNVDQILDEDWFLPGTFKRLKTNREARP